MDQNGAEADESRELDKLAAALAKAQAAIKHADKSREAPVNREGTKKRKYATLADVMEAARPALAANGLAVVQHPSGGAGGLVLTTWLMHESGQWMRSRLAVPYSANAFMSDVQALGSAITYARRYAYAAIAGVAVEDDDGEATKDEQHERSEGAAPVSGPSVFPNFGKAKGGPIAGADPETINVYLEAARRSLADPSKSKWHAKESALIGAYEAELKRQRDASGPVAGVPKDFAPYQQAVILGKRRGWEEENIKHWLKSKRGKSGSASVTAEDVEALRVALEPPTPPPGEKPLFDAAPPPGDDDAPF